ncbi:MAG: NUDIX hydrolase [Candidatus Dojkabacteria bacterium]|nr:MAG: NUDIX hydrolase [Candidatus Dojkabacteria bacterium]
MYESIIAKALQQRAEYQLRHQAFPWGNMPSEGFEACLTDPYGEPFEICTITSAGVLVVTHNLSGGLSVLFVNEEGNRWDIPSEHVELTDRSPADTARREFLEETRLQLTTELYPLTYSIRHNSSRRIGLQFVTAASHFPELNADTLIREDDLGRFYYQIPTETGLYSMAEEPIEVFFSPRDTLLSLYSRNQWAYTKTLAALEEKVALLHESGLLP